MKTYPRVLTIAGSDSGGGAGIQADIKAISATGSYAASAITAVTVQNTKGVSAVHNVPVEIVRGQISAVLSDIGADAVKIGMLSSAELIRAIADVLREYEIDNIVLDPVMIATSGDRLIDEDAIPVLTGVLAPMARVITPNIPEAEVLSGISIKCEGDLAEIGKRISKQFSGGMRQRPVSVLMKAGHLSGDQVTDYFYNAEEDRIMELKSPRIISENTHGTGCTLSSALASYLAQGQSLDEAARLAKDYVAGAIASGADYTIGHGHGPVNHFFRTVPASNPHETRRK